MMSLACGGRGPCCHVGYAHRHCEHCDVVIPLSVQPHTHLGGYVWNVPYNQPYYGTFGQLTNQLQGLQALDAQFNQLGEPEK